MKEPKFKRAYSELYLSDAMLKLGSLFTYGVYDYGYSIEDVWEKFTSSIYGHLFGNGDTHIIAGMSGIEIMRSIEDRYGTEFPIPKHRLVRDSIFWSGWIMAYYQWYTGQSFNVLGKQIDIKDVELLYNPMHEADKMKMVDSLIEYQGLRE